MTPARRRLLLALALAATLAAAAWVGEEADTGLTETELVEARPARARATAAPAPAAAPAPGQRLADEGPDLFPAHSWKPPPKPEPPPKPVELPPPPPPQAPQLPFRHLGSWEDQGVVTHFLAEGDKIQPARPGAMLGSWRIDEVKPGSITFTWLPLNQQRTLRLAP